MTIQIARWGNSLALRIPAQVACRLGVREGDTLDTHLTLDGGWPCALWAGSVRLLPRS